MQSASKVYLALHFNIWEARNVNAWRSIVCLAAPLQDCVAYMINPYLQHSNAVYIKSAEVSILSAGIDQCPSMRKPSHAPIYLMAWYLCTVNSGLIRPNRCQGHTERFSTARSTRQVEESQVAFFQIFIVRKPLDRWSLS